MRSERFKRLYRWMMNLAQFLLSFLAPRAKAFEESTKDPLKIQQKVLLEYLGRNSSTEYGRIYGFSSVKSIAEYQERVPLSDYESIRHYIDRMAKGEPNILTRDKVIFFATTTGTTDKPKLIPETRYSRSRKAALINLWAYYISRVHPKILNGKILAIISPEIEGFTESGIICGAESGHGYKNLPMLIKNFYAVPYEVFEISDYESRYYAILRISLEQNITNIATLNPSTILLLCQKVEKVKDTIIEDIEKGTLDASLIIPEEIRKKLERHLKANPKRAHELKTIVREKGRLLPRYFWPNIELIECWKGGSVKLYLQELSQYFADVPMRDLGCLSSEARSSLAISDEGAGGILSIGTNFFEFIPKEDIDKVRKRVLCCDQLEAGKDYFIIVTTPGGLYRYNIDDIIRVYSFFNKTPVIEFLQKGLSAISVTGEKLYESHLVEAVNRARDEHKLPIKSFCACLQWEGTPPRYVILIEFGSSPTQEEMLSFLSSVESELYKQNIEYKEKRASHHLASPILKVVKDGDFDRYRIKKVEEGAHDGQFKMPRLSADLNFQKNFTIEKEVFLDSPSRVRIQG